MRMRLNILKNMLSLILAAIIIFNYVSLVTLVNAEGSDGVEKSKYKNGEIVSQFKYADGEIGYIIYDDTFVSLGGYFHFLKRGCGYIDSIASVADDMGFDQYGRLWLVENGNIKLGELNPFAYKNRHTFEITFSLSVGKEPCTMLVRDDEGYIVSYIDDAGRNIDISNINGFNSEVDKDYRTYLPEEYNEIVESEDVYSSGAEVASFKYADGQIGKIYRFWYIGFTGKRIYDYYYYKDNFGILSIGMNNCAFDSNGLIWCFDLRDDYIDNVLAYININPYKQYSTKNDVLQCSLYKSTYSDYEEGIDRNNTAYQNYAGNKDLGDSLDTSSACVMRIKSFTFDDNGYASGYVSIYNQKRRLPTIDELLSESGNDVYDYSFYIPDNYILPENAYDSLYYKPNIVKKETEYTYYRHVGAKYLHDSYSLVKNTLTINKKNYTNVKYAGFIKKSGNVIYITKKGQAYIISSSGKKKTLLKKNAKKFVISSDGFVTKIKKKSGSLSVTNK